MLTCSCSLAGTAACLNCSNYISVFGHTWDWGNIEWSYPRQSVTYDTDKYELVEKKDWKLNQLKKVLEEKKNDLEQAERDLKLQKGIISLVNQDIEEIERQLKELEN